MVLNSICKPKMVCEIDLHSWSCLLTGFSRIWGKFKLVRLEDQLSDLQNQFGHAGRPS